MPNPQEQALLELLQQERRRNGTQEPVKEAVPKLADLDPAMFLSASAQQELQAAQRFAAPGVRVTPTDPVVELGTDWDIQESDFNVMAAAPPAPDTFGSALEDLFMARAIRDTGGTRPSSRRSSDLGVEFDMTEPDIDTLRIQMSRSRAGASSGGEVVSRRGAGGFERVAHATREIVRTLEAGASRRSPAPAPVEKAPEPMSRYELLMGPSLID